MTIHKGAPRDDDISFVRAHYQDHELRMPALAVINVLEALAEDKYTSGPREGEPLYDFVTIPMLLEVAGHMLPRATIDKGLQNLEECGYALYVGRKTLDWPHVQGNAGPKSVDCWDIVFDKKAGLCLKEERERQGIVTEKPRKS